MVGMMGWVCQVYRTWRTSDKNVEGRLVGCGGSGGLVGLMVSGEGQVTAEGIQRAGVEGMTGRSRGITPSETVVWPLVASP